MKPIVEVKFTVYDMKNIRDYLNDSYGKLFLLVFLFVVVIGILYYSEIYNWVTGVSVILIIILVISYFGITEYYSDIRRGFKFQGEVKIIKKIKELDSDGPDRYYLEICDVNIHRVDISKTEINYKIFEILYEGDILEIEYLPISKHILKFTKNGLSII